MARTVTEAVRPWGFSIPGLGTFELEFLSFGLHQQALYRATRIFTEQLSAAFPGPPCQIGRDALSPEDTWALVNLIKSFSPRFRSEPPGEAIQFKKTPIATPESISRGKEIYLKNKCGDCHGISGKGDGRLAESLMDAWKHAVFVHDITNPGYFKAGYQPKDIYRNIVGLDWMEPRWNRLLICQNRTVGT